MPVFAQRAEGEPRPVVEAGVVLAVEVEDVLAAGQGAQDRQHSEKAGAEGQSSIGLEESGQAPLELLVEGEGARQVARAGTARAVFVEDRDRRPLEAGILGQPQVVVGAGDDHLPPRHLDGAAVLLGYQLEVGVDPCGHRLVGAGEPESLVEDVSGARRSLLWLLRGVLHKMVKLRVLRQANPPQVDKKLSLRVSRCARHSKTIEHASRKY